MEITRVRIRLAPRRSEKLKAFASVIFDNEFIVNQIKLIEGRNGLFVAMPAVKKTVRCPNCGRKNPLRSNYCNNCGKELSHNDINSSEFETEDIAHPINQEFREYISKTVIEEYNQVLEKVRSKEETDNDAEVQETIQPEPIEEAAEEKEEE